MFIEALFVITRISKHPNSPQLKNGQRKCGTFIQQSITWLINDIRKFEGKWMELEEKKIILSEVAQTQKDKHGMYSLISEY